MYVCFSRHFMASIFTAIQGEAMHVGQAFHEHEGIVIGTLDESGTFRLAVDPSKETPHIRKIVEAFCTRNTLRQSVETPSR
jgi:hypothetical protein